MQPTVVIPPECPFEFPLISGTGGRLLTVKGPPEKAMWTAEYSVPTPKVNICRHCNKPIGDTKDDDRGATVAAIADRNNPTLFIYERVHPICAVQLAEAKVTRMATASWTADLPDCAICGEAYNDHGSTMSVFGAYCDVEWEKHWQPAWPFPSRHWPHRLIASSPWHTSDGKTGFVETFDEAIERMRRLANGLTTADLDLRVAVRVQQLRQDWRAAA